MGISTAEEGRSSDGIPRPLATQMFSFAYSKAMIYPGKSKPYVNPGSEVQQLPLFRVDAFQHQLGVALGVELDEISIIVVHLHVLRRVRV